MPALEPIEKLIASLSKMPGVGKRSAERMANAIIRQEGLSRDLQLSLREVETRVMLCSRCASITIREQNPCRLCSDPRRDDKLLCVVEDPSDIQSLERSGVFRGRYHALLGKISPMKGQGLADTRVDKLLQRVREDKVEEVILALNTDVESDATAAFIREALANQPVKVTRLARGIPSGSGVAYSDSVTLAQALKGRQPL